MLRRSTKRCARMQWNDGLAQVFLSPLDLFASKALSGSNSSTSSVFDGSESLWWFTIDCVDCSFHTNFVARHISSVLRRRSGKSEEKLKDSHKEPRERSEDPVSMCVRTRNGKAAFIVSTRRLENQATPSREYARFLKNKVQSNCTTHFEGNTNYYLLFSLFT